MGRKYRENFEVLIKNENNNEIDKKVIKSQKPSLSGKADNILLTTNFTLKNFKKVFYEDDFLDLLLTTFYFTFFGTIGAIFFGILAAQLVKSKFLWQIIYEKYLAFSICWACSSFSLYLTLLLDPNSGTFNALMVNFKIFLMNQLIYWVKKYMVMNVFGFELKLRLALTTVIFFEIWRYFP